MIKHTLKEGNRVRVVTHNGGVQNQDCEQSHLFGETGIVVRVDPNFADVRIKLEDKEIECIEEVDYRCLKRIDRTFEEIIKELGNNKIITDFYCRDQDFPYGDNRDHSCEFFCMDEDEHSYVGFEIFDDGKVRMMEIFSAAELAAISAACGEIADNYKAEHANDNSHE